MSRATVCVLGVLIAAACGGTTELGSERDSVATNGGGGAGGANPAESVAGGGSGGVAGVAGATPSSGGNAGEDGVFPPDAGDPPSFPSPECRGRRCGHFCSFGPGGKSSEGFCNREGECSIDAPMCDSDRCMEAEDCTHGPGAARHGNCLECNDQTISCGEVGCADGFCTLAPAGCATGVAQCKIDDNCLAATLIPCEPCAFGPPACPRSRCIDEQCVIQYPHCDEYSPCGGKPCGAPCRVCPMDDPNCIETPEIEICNPEGECVIGANLCN